MSLNKYADHRRPAPRSEWEGRHRRHREGLHSVEHHEDVYSDDERKWLCAVDRWKVCKGPVIRAAELLVLLADLGYRREGTLPAADIDAALEQERRRRAHDCGRPGRFLTACEVLLVLRELGWRKEG